MYITLTTILTQKPELLSITEKLGFINLRLTKHTNNELYFIADVNPLKIHAKASYISLLEACFKDILGCDLCIRAENTTEQSLWLMLLENSVSVLDTQQIVAKFGKNKTEEVVFAARQLDEIDKKYLEEYLLTVQEVIASIGHMGKEDTRKSYVQSLQTKRTPQQFKSRLPSLVDDLLTELQPLSKEDSVKWLLLIINRKGISLTELQQLATEPCQLSTLGMAMSDS
jgi:hypothetical protein